MPRGAGTQNLSDRYINLFCQSESTTGTSLLSYEYETGMSPRGGYIWEIHSVEITFNSNATTPAANSIHYWQLCLSFVGNESAMPVLTDYGVIWKRIMCNIGNGTSASQTYFEPATSVMFFPRPFLYCKNKLYAYFQTSLNAAAGFQFRLGYTTKKISGSLLWEAVEQFLSEGN